MIQWAEVAVRQLEEHEAFMLMTGHHDPSSVISRIFDAIEQTVLNPYIGREVGDNLFKLTIADPPYVVHYTATDCITVVGVYHQRQQRPL